MKNKFTEPFEDVYDQDYKSYDVVKNAEGKATEAVESELRGLDSNEHMSGVAKAEESFTRARIDAIRKSASYSARADMYDISISSEFFLERHGVNVEEMDPSEVELFVLAYDSAKPEHERDRVKKIAEAVDTVKSESRLKSYAQENRARIDSVREGAKS